MLPLHDLSNQFRPNTGRKSSERSDDRERQERTRWDQLLFPPLSPSTKLNNVGAVLGKRASTEE